MSFEVTYQIWRWYLRPSLDCWAKTLKTPMYSWTLGVARCLPNCCCGSTYGKVEILVFKSNISKTFQKHLFDANNWKLNSFGLFKPFKLSAACWPYKRIGAMEDYTILIRKKYWKWNEFIVMKRIFKEWRTRHTRNLKFYQASEKALAHITSTHETIHQTNLLYSGTTAFWKMWFGQSYNKKLLSEFSSKTIYQSKWQEL